MERVQSLINKLATMVQVQASAAELLKTTELLYAELKGLPAIESFSVNEGVAVWLPFGYSGSKSKSASGQNGSVKEAEPFSEKSSLVSKPVEEKEPDSIPVESTEPIASSIIVERPASTPQVPRVPVPPPHVTIIEPEPVKPEEKTPIPKKDVSQIPAMKGINSGEEKTVNEEVEKIESPAATIKAAPTPPPPPKPEPVSNRPFPQYPDAASLMKNIFPLAPDPAPPVKEVNQLVVDPVVQLNEKLVQKQVELGEVLGAGPKITDLRKAISINDKYQMISSLFRNDEDMFERSIRTLNNFGSLPEARFWMQRELIIKLGWNENDEMVQHFYKLVSRRFA